MSRHRLDTLILFVTSRCNARCRTCFYWEELNQSDDLSREELERLSSTMPSFKEIWLSGGEPTLRTDLPGIVESFVRNNGIRSINLPVNGLNPTRLVACVEEICRTTPALRVNLNLALDGIGETHDRIRGVAGNFERALTSLESLQDLRQNHDSLRLHVNTVICRENLSEIVELATIVRERFDLDGHYFQVIRGRPADPALLALSREELAAVYDQLAPTYRHYAARVRERRGGVAGGMREASYLGVQRLYHEIQLANLDRHDPWPMRCSAGDNIVVVDANGDVRACELRGRLANLREFDCDWNRFWGSDSHRDELKSIEDAGCWCTHVCFIHASVKRSSKAKLSAIPRAYLRERRGEAWAESTAGV